MLFGLFGNQRAFRAAWRDCEPLFAQLGELETQRLSETAFEDPFVLGFLQPVVIGAANADAGGAVETEIWQRTLHGIVERLAPSMAERSMRCMAALAAPHHSQNTAYLAGQREGNIYVGALHADDEAKAERVKTVFRAFLERTYLR